MITDPVCGMEVDKKMPLLQVTIRVKPTTSVP